jgi:hypothetical protein
MRSSTDELERDLLLLFRRAYRQNNFEVAEHLLQALELLNQKPVDRSPANAQDRLQQAYLEITRQR